MADTFLITHTRSTGRYQVWSYDPEQPAKALVLAEHGELEEDYVLTRVAGYYLLYKPRESDAYVDYMLIDGFTPYPAPLGELKQTGSWYWDKFTGSYSFTDTPGGAQVDTLSLKGVGGYVLSQIQTRGRRSFALWNFDAYVDQPGRSIDPIADSMADPSAFPTIRAGEILIPITNYVLAVDDALNTWRVFSFDPQQPDPLTVPEISSGTLPEGIASDKLVALGDQLFAIKDGGVQVVFTFHPSDPFSQMIEAKLPADLELAEGTTLIAGHRPSARGVEPASPGTIEYMREKVQHVVVYVLESRSFDNVLGWLYDASTSGQIHWVGDTAGATFEGASTDHTNTDDGVSYAQNKYRDGATGDDVTLDAPYDDPFHDTPDAIHQQWTGGYAAYQRGDAADMGGFVLNNGNDAVMATYTPDQLTVLNGLAKSFAVSDMWFCSEAGTTTANRAAIATGSALDVTVSFEGGNAYTYFPEQPRRQSIWKVLSNFAISDWALYYSVLWEGFPYTYHLYLKGQLPSVDAYPGSHVQPIASFYDAIEGEHLKRFSFLEPVWYDPSGVFTSYHPTGDVLPGEAALKKIYDAIANSPKYRENTVLVISFSKGGGLYDHVPAHPMARAWPHDSVAGYGFDTTGTRVPTIVVSPWVQQNTVFRSKNAQIPYDGTSLAATVLSWFDIPRAAWCMGERIANAPTFEDVFTLTTARTDVPTFTRAADKTWPAGVEIPLAAPTPVSSTWASTGTGVWTSTSSWVPAAGTTEGELPTDVATFGAGSQTQVSFAYIDPQVVNEVRFTEDAPSYTLLFDEEQPLDPMLTIAGAGVTNASQNLQTFEVRASSTDTDQVQLMFVNSASAGSNVHYSVAPTTPSSQSGGIIAFHQRATAGSASFEVGVGSRPPQGYATVGGEIRFLDDSSAGSASFTATGTTGVDSDTFGNIVFHNRAKAGTAHFVNVGGIAIDGVHGDGGNTQFYEQASAESATITNQGGTGGNGGDVAFDGTATAANAAIVNLAADAGYGGVTSFNNNKPYMSPFSGASAGQATIVNRGASAGQTGSGGHTEFTGIYGSGTAYEATIENHGASADTGNSSAGGYTLFAVNGRWPYCTPTAGRASIRNHPAGAAGADPGSTQFIYQNWDGDGDENAAGPSADNATITNLGASIANADGGFTRFDDRATAGWSTLTNQAGSVAGAGGGTTTFEGNATADHATLSASGGVGQAGSIVFSDYATGGRPRVSVFGGVLDYADSKNHEIELGTLSTSEATLRCSAAGTSLSVLESTSFVGNCTFAFIDTVAPTGAQVLIYAESLQPGDEAHFHGNAIGGLNPTFAIDGNTLTVTFA